METKQLIQEKLELHKRQTVTNEIINKCANHLFDAFREIEMAIQYCDNPEIRGRLEQIKGMIGHSTQTAEDVETVKPTAISELQSLMKDFY